MKKLYIAVALCMLSGVSYADPLQWNIPGGVGTIQLPFQSTELLAGYDFILKQTIAGASLPVLTLFPGKTLQLDGQLGAVGEFQTQAPNIQPYIALGKDLARLIPALDSFKSFHINGFSRWDTSSGGSFKDHLGAGGSISYSFNLPFHQTQHLNDSVTQPFLVGIKRCSGLNWNA